MCGRGLSSWEHGIWYVKWLMDVSKLMLALPILCAKFALVASYIINVNQTVLTASENVVIIVSVSYSAYQFGVLVIFQIAVTCRVQTLTLAKCFGRYNSQY